MNTYFLYNFINFENFINNICFIVLFINVGYYWIQIFFGNIYFINIISNFGFINMCISNFLLFSSLVLRWKSSQHFPLSNHFIYN